jgi:fructosamine-3-kinase
MDPTIITGARPDQPVSRPGPGLGARLGQLLDRDDLELTAVPGAQRPGLYCARGRADRGRPVAFVKLPPAGSAVDMRIEARMLSDLAGAGLAVPRVLAALPDLLVAEWIEHDSAGQWGPIRPIHERAAARALAGLHRLPADGFGYPLDTPLGVLVQPNAPTVDWRAFFRDRRLLHFAGLARAAGMLAPALDARIAQLADRLGEHIGEPAHPALLHGDLWYGNILTRGTQLAALVDPAVYRGDPEIELAYVLMHGTFGRAFFDAYGELRPIPPGFLAERAPVYLIAHHLAHALLCGPVYLGGLDRLLRRIGR